jgi:hypothetical protein
LSTEQHRELAASKIIAKPENSVSIHRHNLKKIASNKFLANMYYLHLLDKNI